MNADDLRALGRHVAERQDAAPFHADEASRRALADYVTRRPERVRRRSVLRIALPGLAIAAACVLGIALTRGGPEPLTFRVGDASEPSSVPAEVTAQAAEIPIRFSDGTALVVEPGSSAEVVGVAPNGAEVVLDSGSASVSVVPSAGGNWQVRTGPFVVQVHGTRFDVSWDPTEDHFRLALYAGRVVVTGCAFGHGQAITAGQEVEASCERRELSVKPIAARTAPSTHPSAPGDRPGTTELRPEATSADAPSAVTSPKGPAVLPPAQRAASSAAAAPISWKTLAADGRYRDAYGAARLEGFDALCRTLSASDLLLLGDTARHAGQLADSRQAYTMVRSRFTGAGQAATAAFSLGRLAFDGAHDYADAGRWFRVYREEQPGGALAQAALGRLLEIATRSGDSSASRIAQQYLDEYPDGPRADDARAILGVESARPAR